MQSIADCISIAIQLIHTVWCRVIAGYKGSIPVAVKMLSSQEPEVVAKFLEEADLMKRFTHPNIVSILGRYLCLKRSSGHSLYLSLSQSLSVLRPTHTGGKPAICAYWADNAPGTHSAMMTRYIPLTPMMSSLNRVKLHNRAP